MLILLGFLLGAMLLGADVETLDTLNIVAPLLLGVAVLCLIWTVYAAVRFRMRTLAAVATALALAYVGVGGLLLRPLWAAPPELGTDGTSFTVVSFNMNKDNRNFHQVASWIDEQSADFVVLLEARDVAAPVLQALHRKYPYQYDCRGNGTCSTVILSTRPALSVTRHAHGDTENRRALSALTARFDQAGHTLALTAVHMPRPWPFGKQTVRMREFAAVASTPRTAHLVAGDFNNVPWTFAMNRMAMDMHLNLLSGAIPSWPTSTSIPFLPIDHLYGSDCIEPAAVARGPNLGSDHYPMVISAVLTSCDG